MILLTYNISQTHLSKRVLDLSSGYGIEPVIGTFVIKTPYRYFIYILKFTAVLQSFTACDNSSHSDQDTRKVIKD